MKNSEIRQMLLAGQNAGCYTPATKEVYRRLSLKFLRRVRALMGLTAETCDVRFNPGGIAVCGDAILHSNRVYVQISWSTFHIGGGLGVLVRTCNGRKDYTGDRNTYYSLEHLIETRSDGADGLAQYALTLTAEKYARECGITRTAIQMREANALLSGLTLPCKHVPHNPDSMQTVCEHCGEELDLR